MAVPTFFALSAFLFFRTCKPDTYLTKMGRRLRTLVIPYLIWNVIGFLYAYVASNVPAIARMTGLSPVPLSLSVLPDILLSAYTTLWYVRNLLAYFLIAPLLFPILRRPAAALAVFGGLSLYNLLAGYEYYSLLTWLPMFLLGAYAGVHCPDLHREPCRMRPAVRVALIAAATVAFAAAVYRYGDTAEMYLFRLLSPVVLYAVFSRLHLPAAPRWATISFFLYCSHLYILPVFQKGLLLFLGHEWLPVLAVYLLTPFVIVPVVTAAALVLRRFLPRLWTLLTGGR